MYNADTTPSATLAWENFHVINAKVQLNKKVKVFAFLKRAEADFLAGKTCKKRRKKRKAKRQK